MTSPLPASDDGSASMVFDDDQSEAEKEQLLGKGREAGQGGEHEAESDEASVPSQVLEDEDSNCSSMGAAGATASNQTKALQQLDHLQDVSLAWAAGAVRTFNLLSCLFPPRPSFSPPSPSQQHNNSASSTPCALLPKQSAI